MHKGLGQMVTNSSSILVTKIYPPRLRPNSITRPALLTALNTVFDYKLAVVAAAAGFGKTSLLADWSQHRQDVCWFSLDEGDNDPIRFLSYLVAAIQTRHPHLGQELFTALQSPQPPPATHALHSLINQLAATPGQLLLVLDDYHVIENPTVHQSLTFLLDHLPPQKTVALLTRTDPALPLGRLRAKNELLELRAAALRFSAVEMEQFFNQTLHLTLPPQDILALDARIEGWVAGLQLAAIALQAAPQEINQFIHQFTGSHRFVLDYLMEEVLLRQPQEVRRFLLHTSFLRRLNGELCDAVTEGKNGRFMLDYLEKHHLFLVPLDYGRYWYRYHHLFADLLQAHFQAEDAALLPTLRRRAAHWHAQNNLPEEAVSYALAGQDFDYAAELMVGPAAHMMQRGEVITLLEWYQRFPPAFITQYPRLALQFGMAFALNGRWAEAETLLITVEGENTAVSSPEALLLAYLVAVYRQDAARLTTLAQEMLARPNLDRITKLTLGLVFNLKGDLSTACQLLAESQAASEQEGDTLLALTALFHQCLIHVFLGNLQKSHHLSQRALQQAHQLGGAAMLMAGFAHAALARVFIEWDQPQKAEEHLQQAIHLSELNGLITGMLSSCTMMLAEVKQAQGDPTTANQLAQKALVYAAQYDPAPEVAWLKVYQARIWLNQGNTAVFSHWLPTLQTQHQTISMFYPTHIQTITQARALLAQRKTEQALPLLLQLAAQPPNLLTIETLILLAIARQTQGDTIHALLTLEQALSLAETENRIRVFLESGQPLAKLLARFSQEHPTHLFARRLLDHFNTTLPPHPTTEHLSERELDVLRLIAAGYSNEEIARSLTLAMSTVKWYINTLYSKLHVKTRSQAILRARELLGNL